MLKGQKKQNLKVSKIYNVKNEQKMQDTLEVQKIKAQRVQKPQEPQQVLCRTDATCISSSQQHSCASLSLGMCKKESELHQPFIRIAQIIAEMLVDSSQNQHQIVGVWTNTHKKEPKTTNIDSNISLIPDICFVQGDTPDVENVTNLRN